MSNVLEISAVSKYFKNKQILSDVYLICRTGDVIGLFGRNGSGKTTLLQILFGVAQAENKFIRINGKAYQNPFSTSGLLCYLPQHNFLPENLSVEKIVNLYCEKDQRVNFSTDPFICSLMKNKVSVLSGGEKRYLEIKLLLLQKVMFVLLDEPFNGVSPLQREQLTALIKQGSASKGIILTDHDYNAVLETAGTYRLLFDGGIKTIENKFDLMKWGYLLRE